MKQSTSRLQARSPQRGFSFLSLLFVGGIVAVTGVVVAQVVPTVIEYQGIQKAVKKVAQGGGSTPAELRAAFDRQQNIDDFKAIMGKDLDITKNGDKVVIKFAYDKQIPLFGPAYLLIKYEGSSSD
jgi:hypothetical protein